MRETFKSKKDGWLVTLVGSAGVIGVGTGVWLLSLGHPVGLLPLIVLGIVGLLLVPMRYVLGENELLIQSGLLRWRVPLAEIRSVRPTSNPLSSPAWSLDRLEIEYRAGGGMRTIMISPEQQMVFLAKLAQAAPQAKIEKQG